MASVAGWAGLTESIAIVILVGWIEGRRDRNTICLVVSDAVGEDVDRLSRAEYNNSIIGGIMRLFCSDQY
jgi:hypothetical protein